MYVFFRLVLRLYITFQQGWTLHRCLDCVRYSGVEYISTKSGRCNPHIGHVCFAQGLFIVYQLVYLHRRGGPRIDHQHMAHTIPTFTYPDGADDSRSYQETARELHGFEGVGTANLD